MRITRRGSRFSDLIQYAFHPVRTGELIVVCAATWWVVAVKWPGREFAGEGLRYFSHSMTDGLLFVAAVILMWINFFRKIDNIRAFLLMVPIGVGAVTTTLIGLSVKHHPSPSMGMYLGIVWLAIFNYMEDQEVRK